MMLTTMLRTKRCRFLPLTTIRQDLPSPSPGAPLRWQKPVQQTHLPLFWTLNQRQMWLFPWFLAIPGKQQYPQAR